LVLLTAAGTAMARADSRTAPAGADLDELVTELRLRVEALEKNQGILLQRIAQLEEMRVLELETLLDLHRSSGPTADIPVLAQPVAEPPAAAAQASSVPVAHAADDVIVEEGPGTGGDEADEEDQSVATPFVQHAADLIDEEEYRTAERILTVAVEQDPEYDRAYFWRGYARARMKLYEEALEDFQVAIDVTDSQSVRYTSIYNQACVYALAGNADKAIEHLHKSREAGFQKILDQMSTDPDLDSIRHDPRYREFELILRYP
jgi:tetratricopeptide (TPR) repeat protein